MKRFFLGIMSLLIVCGVVYAATGTTNGYFYLPEYGASGQAQRDAMYNAMEATDAVIEANKDHRVAVDAVDGIVIGDGAGGYTAATQGTQGNCVEWGASGDLADAGAACGSGGSGSGDITAVGSCTSGACFADGTNNTLTFEGSTVDTVEAILTVEDPTVGDQTFRLPNQGASGTYDLLVADSAIVYSTEIDTFSELNAIVADKDLINTTDSFVSTGYADFGGGKIELPNSTTLPATCTTGEEYLDTDAGSGQKYFCNPANTWVQVVGTGDVVGPASATDNAFARFNGTGGKTIQNSTAATLSDTGAASFLSVTVAGTGAGQLNLTEGASAQSTGASELGLWVDSSDTTLQVRAVSDGTSTGVCLEDGTNCVITTTQITDGTITEADLKVVDSPADEECFTYESTTGDFEWQSCTSGTTPENAVILPVQSAKLSGSFVTDGDASQGAQIDGGEPHWKLLFDATTDEGAVWQLRMPGNYSSAPLLKVLYTAASATSGTVEWEGAIMCVSDADAADIATASFSTIAVATESVPATAGYLTGVSITLTDDSCAAGDMVWVYLSTDADDGVADTATGDREVVGVTLTYTGS